MSEKCLSFTKGPEITCLSYFTGGLLISCLPFGTLQNSLSNETGSQAISQQVQALQLVWCMLFSSVVICQSNYFGFTFRELVTTTVLEQDPLNQQIDGGLCLHPPSSTSKDGVFIA